MPETEQDGRGVRRPAPRSAPALIRRPALEDRLDEIFGKRLTLVVAGPGFGKSTMLASWTSDLACAWYTVGPRDAALPTFCRGVADTVRAAVPGLTEEISQLLASRPTTQDEDEDLGAEAFAARLCELLQRQLDHDLVLVLDDVHELGTARAPARLVEGLCRQAPETLHLVVSSRTLPAFPVERLRGQGHVLEIDASMLAFDVDEVALLLQHAVDADAVALATELQQATAGWPAAVRLAAEALRDVPAAERDAAIRAIRGPGGPVFAYLAEEVFDREATDVQNLIELVAPLGRFTPSLCEALGVEDAAETISGLVRRGLLVHSAADREGWFDVHDLVREFVIRRRPPRAEELARVHQQAAAWFEGHGFVSEAFDSLVVASNDPSLSAFLEEHGTELILLGRGDDVVVAGGGLASELQTIPLLRVLGAAHLAGERLDRALECFEQAGASAGALDPALAWSIASVHYNRGDFNAVVETYSRTDVSAGGVFEEARALSVWSNVHALRGEIETARSLATRSVDVARRGGHDAALAYAYHALGMVARAAGDKAEAVAAYRDELDAAARSGETMQLIRGSNGLADVLLGGEDHAEALQAVENAIRLAELPGFRTVLPYALDTRGRLHASQGRFEDALADFKAAKAFHRRRRSSFAAEQLVAAGDIHRERGDLAVARAAYDEAVALAAPVSLRRVLRAAYAGLARLEAAEDREAAEALLDQASALGEGEWSEVVLVSAAWVAALHGEEAKVREHAQTILSGVGDDGRLLAESLELRAVVDPTAAVGFLEQARSIWRGLGDSVGSAKAAFALARLAPTSPASASPAQAERRLRELGIHVGAAARAAGLLSCLPADEPPAVGIRSLGGFAVVRDGEPVALAEWGSKRARDLLKILVAHRGRPVARDTLMELLWPGEDPARLSNRLSNALSLLRGVLDPGKRFPADHYVGGDKTVVALNRTRVASDVEAFLDDAAAGLAAIAQGRTEDARELLELAEGSYAGDFLEESLYDDWAVSLREEARSVYVQVARELAGRAEARNEHETASRYLLRILERDAYDEEASLALVRVLAAAGRHGDARRNYVLYAGRMKELGVEAAPFPATA